MASKKQYYALDEVGFIGTQTRSEAQVKKDIEKTIQYIKAKKTGKLKSLTYKQRLSKVK